MGICRKYIADRKWNDSKKKEKEQMINRIKAEALAILVKIIVLVLIFWVLLFGAFGVYRIDDYAMSPSCKDGDIIFFDRTKKDYQAGDLVVFSKEGETQIRRIVAVPGEQVEVTQEGLIVDGYLQSEREITTETLPFENDVSYPVQLGAQEYFVLADKRDSAIDSRWYGTINKEEIHGSVILLFRRRGF